MDMTDMKFGDAKYDIVLDKGSMDALTIDEGDVWYPNESTIRCVHRMCHSVSRVLKIGGKFISISFNQPHFRTKYLMGQWMSHSESQEDVTI